MKSLRPLLCCVLTLGVALPVAAQFDQDARTTLNYYPGASVTYTGQWHLGEMITNWSGGTAAVSNFRFGQPGVKVTLTFGGTGVTWIGARHPEGGQVMIWVDGVGSSVPYDTCGLTPENACDPTRKELQAPIFTISGLEQGAHWLDIIPTGTRKDTSQPAPQPTISCGGPINCRVVVDAYRQAFCDEPALFAAVGAMCSTQEEATQAAQPVMMLLVATIIVVQPILTAPTGTMAPLALRV